MSSVRASEVLDRARQRRCVAQGILEALSLVERWSRYGRPVIVGALSYDLVVAPDIDMEIYCPDLRIEHGFEVLQACALQRGVTDVRFMNGLATPDKALYWQMHYAGEDGQQWKIDMWSAPSDYDLPRSEFLVEPMRRALTPETRLAILELKETRAADKTLECLSIDLYRAVMDDGVRTPEMLRAWLASHKTGELTAWRPTCPR